MCNWKRSRCAITAVSQRLQLHSPSCRVPTRWLRQPPRLPEGTSWFVPRHRHLEERLAEHVFENVCGADGAGRGGIRRVCNRSKAVLTRIVKHR